MQIPPQVYTPLAALVKEFEGLRLTSYRDVAGHYTVGYGHKGSPAAEGVSITLAQAEALLEQDCESHYADLLGLQPFLAQAASGTQAALTDFVYNLGIGTYKDSSVRKYVEQGLWEAAKVVLSHYVYAAGVEEPGLKRRRAAEIALIGETT